MTDTTIAEEQPITVLVQRRQGAEYNLPTGLNWERVNREYRENATEEEQVRGRASAKAIQRGGADPSTMRAAADAGWASHQADQAKRAERDKLEAV